MKSNFVVFSEPRTGSTLFTSILNHQKDILCLKEIFRAKDLHAKAGKNFNEKIKKLLGSDHSEWEKNRNEKFIDFINLLSEMSNKKIFGYKFHRKHFKAFKSQESYLNFLKTNNTKIIILERKNVLLRYISQLTAASIGLYSSKKTKKGSEKVFQLNPIKIDYEKYIKYNKNNKIIYKDKFKIVQDYGLAHIHIIYEDFIGEKAIECFKKIFNFLDLNFEDFIDPRNYNRNTIAGHKKINVYKLQDKIINYAEFKKAAEDNNDIETLNFLRE
jgi:LPS sulfotransferase NodH